MTIRDVALIQLKFQSPQVLNEYSHKNNWNIRWCCECQVDFYSFITNNCVPKENSTIQKRLRKKLFHSKSYTANAIYWPCHVPERTWEARNDLLEARRFGSFFCHFGKIQWNDIRHTQTKTKKRWHFSNFSIGIFYQTNKWRLKIIINLTDFQSAVWIPDSNKKKRSKANSKHMQMFDGGARRREKRNDDTDRIIEFLFSKTFKTLTRSAKNGNCMQMKRIQSSKGWSKVQKHSVAVIFFFFIYQTAVIRRRNTRKAERKKHHIQQCAGFSVSNGQTPKAPIQTYPSAIQPRQKRRQIHNTDRTENRKTFSTQHTLPVEENTEEKKQNTQKREEKK